jgi:tRNA A37 threonylcarbamoyladenosine dehydratase
MNAEDHRHRFGGIARLYGEEGYQRILRGSAMVIGVGGVGSWTAEALARSGIGHLILVDMDDICVTNTNRQVHAHDGNFGKPKIVALGERLRSIHPGIRLEERFDFITADNVSEHLTDPTQVVVDAIDSVKPKAALIAHCRRRRIPLVTVGGAGGQRDPTRIKVDDLARTVQDPLLASVRRRLRTDYGFPGDGKGKFGITAVYSTEPLKSPSVCENDAPTATRLDCSGGLGASTCVTASFGMVAAARALDMLLKPVEATA